MRQGCSTRATPVGIVHALAPTGVHVRADIHESRGPLDQRRQYVGSLYVDGECLREAVRGHHALLARAEGHVVNDGVEPAEGVDLLGHGLHRRDRRDVSDHDRLAARKPGRYLPRSGAAGALIQLSLRATPGRSTSQAGRRRLESGRPLLVSQRGTRPPESEIRVSSSLASMAAHPDRDRSGRAPRHAARQAAVPRARPVK
jgi:hypothetical protein